MMGPLLLATLLRLGPVSAAHFAAEAEGLPVEVAERLVGVCYRESRCRPHGLHVLDAWVSHRAWRGQVRLGHIDPECQPYRDPEWATRGAFGLSAADHWRYLPKCYKPEILDHTLVSALVASRKWAKRCSSKTRRGWCRARQRRLDLSARSR
jgi:hypothetical protein